MPSESTLKQYASRIAILTKAGISPMGNPQSLLKWFEANKHGESSQKLYLSAIKNMNPEKFPKVLQDKINELYGKQNLQDKEQKLTAKQEINYVKFEDILAAQKKLADKPTKTAAEMKQYLIISLYTLNAPVRADYGDMLLFKKYNKDRKGNELIVKKNMEFVFREYKTAKTYGEVRIKVSKPLQAVITEYLASLGATPKYLFGEKEINPNSFAVLVADTMKKLVGKEVGVSLLRHSYITHMYPSLNTIKKKEDLARRMLHDKERQEMYRFVQA